MYKTFTIRLLPTNHQAACMMQHVNAARYVWNWGLRYEMDLFDRGEKFVGGYNLKKVLTQVKKQEGNEWLKDVSSQTLNDSILVLYQAYNRFFSIQKRGERFAPKTIIRAKKLGKKLTPYDMKGHPKFKSKYKAKPSFYVRSDSLYFSKGVCNVEKIGKIQYQTNYKLPEGGRRSTRFNNPHIVFENDKWLLKFGMEVPSEEVTLNDFSCGIDLGVKELAVVSCNGKKLVVSNHNKTRKAKKLNKRIKYVQRKLSRQRRNSKNYGKTLKRLQQLHWHKANRRKDYNHKATAMIVNMLPKSIAIEDLNIRGMLKNQHLSKAIGEQGFYQFRQFLEYKCKEKGIALIVANRFYPSSKRCSNCGSIKKDLTLSQRTYRCGNCGLELDRDYNAAVNLEKLGLEQIGSRLAQI